MDLTEISVTTFNLMNFQLPGRSMHPGQKPWTQAEYDAKVDWIGRTLLDLDPDVVGLQELWHRDAMAAVLEHAGLSDVYDLLAAPADGSSIICAALVRKGLLVGSPTWLEAFPDAVRLESNEAMDTQSPEISVRIRGFSRPVLRFQVALRDAEPHTEVFVTHLKSKLATRIDTEQWYRADPATYQPHTLAIGTAISTIRRTAEAAALRVLLTGVMKGSDTPVIVLGDVNDDKTSNTVGILTEQPRYLVGQVPGGADNGLYTAQTLQELRSVRDVYYTYVHEEVRESLDQVLVSEQFYDMSRKRKWLFDGLVITNDHLNEEDHKARGTSDHGVVRVRFRWRPATA